MKLVQIFLDLTKVKAMDARPDKLSGRICLANTRISVGQILAEIADTGSVEKVADDFGLRVSQINDMLNELSDIIYPVSVP